MLRKEWDRKDFKVFGSVFGRKTLLALYRLINKGVFDRMYGELFSGKEANIFFAECDGEPLILKIYRIETADFNNMLPYVAGDPRFDVPKNKRKMVYEWTGKEYKNLMRFSNAGVRVPRPIAFHDNILAMEFVGDNAPAPTVRVMPPKKPQEFYDALVTDISLGLEKARLVHADLSEYNVLNFGVPVIIDCGQAVDRRHPRAKEFFERDVKNINSFFKKRCLTREIEWIS